MSAAELDPLLRFFQNGRMFGKLFIIKQRRARASCIDSSASVSCLAALLKVPARLCDPPAMLCEHASSHPVVFIEPCLFRPPKQPPVGAAGFTRSSTTDSRPVGLKGAKRVSQREKFAMITPATFVLMVIIGASPPQYADSMLGCVCRPSGPLAQSSPPQVLSHIPVLARRFSRPLWPDALWS
jgi:hypothetical protein